MFEQELQIYGILKKLSIDYERYSHPPVSTMKELDSIIESFEEIHCKNIFLRNSKGDKHYLILVKGHKIVNLKEIAKTIGSTRLSFASEERLKQYLGVQPGAVSPLGLVNDKLKEVIVLVDKDLTTSPYMTFHPNVNTVSITMKYNDFIKFIDWCGNSVDFIDIS